ncbi:serine/threonine-protein kinase DCLK1 [Vairimorpha necatrix]|uniref:Serine/threonine-protein kinase DCLK1 n=1 Tax=Vairimorpha necatrix TaxID=6039 RepID=A0AAX4JCU1_9MICR
MKYILKNIIGEGACGKVYKGLSNNNELVSIKIIPKNKKSQKEINILSTINHENIVKFIDVCKDSQDFWLITELCEYNLITFINQYNVDCNIAKKIIRMVLLGLEYLHSHNIIHRDIKLGNILINDNSIKICDFGLSCYENKNKFTVCGTEDYVAPEVINKTSYTKSIDIYSTGKVFKTLLSLKNQYDNNCNDLMMKMLEENPLRRITAYEALRHPVFEDFLPKFCDFRYLKNFKINERCGIIEKIDNVVYFDNSKVEIYDLRSAGLTKRNIINIAKSKNSEDFNTSNLYNMTYNNILDYEFVFYYKNIKTEIFLFTNSELKKIIYGMAYLNINMERLTLIIIEDKDYKFTYRLNDTYVYIEDKMTIKRRYDKGKKIFFYEKTDMVTRAKTQFETLPEMFKKRKMDDLYQKCRRNLINIDLKNLPLLIRPEDLKSNINLKNLPTVSSFGSFMDMKLIEDIIYRHKFDIGWCIKKKTNLIILLNNGERLEIELLEMLVIYRHDKFIINNNLPIDIKKYLKTIRPLLLMYL